MSRKFLAGIISLFISLLVIALVLIVVFLVKHTAANNSGQNEHQLKHPWLNYRLSNTTVPEFYNLTIKPWISDGIFEGNVSILVTVDEPTDVIYLHIFNLNVTEVQLTKVDGDENSNVKIQKSFEYKENEYWVVVTEKKLHKGIIHKLRLKNLKIMLATTKFEPTYARRAFPCFDEPNKKANYSITIIHNVTEHPTVLSNMPKESSELQEDGWNRTTFETSIKMSTYLVCFIISDYEFLENKTNNGVTMRTYAPSDRVNLTKFALDTATKLLDYYDDYFDIPYSQSISKLDLVSIPDFISGAMENWGVITFREVNLLFTEGKGSAGIQERVAYVICHELAHMWFGNVVTMDWWDDLWLNEGFATWIGFVLAMDHVNKEWNGDTKFLVERLQPVMIRDATKTSHPIIMPMWHPDNFSSAFDAITYSKGAAVIRMLEGYLSRNVFREGIRNMEVKKLMHAWTLNAGFPVLTYNATTTGPAELIQRRYYSNPDVANANQAISFNWLIPVTATFSNGNRSGPFLMDKERQSVHFPLSGNKLSWTKLNDDQKGFYHVNYVQETWEAIIKQLQENHLVFDSSDRSQLIDDSFKLAGAGFISYETPLKLAKYIQNERSSAPWYTFQLNIAYLNAMLKTAAPETYILFSQYIKSLSEPVFNDLGWDDSEDTNNDKKLRKYVIALACKHGVETCAGNASQLFEQWIKTDSFWISSNYRKSVFKYGMEKSGSFETWDIVWKRYLMATPENKRDLSFALSRINVPWILKLYIDLAQNETYVRSQDYFTVMAYISGNAVGNSIAYAYVKGNWLKLVQRFSLNDRYLGRLVPRIIEDFNSRSQLQDVQDFFKRYPEAGAGANARKQAISNIQRNIEWVEKNVKNIDQFLRS